MMESDVAIAACIAYSAGTPCIVRSTERKGVIIIPPPIPRSPARKPDPIPRAMRDRKMKSVMLC